MKLFECCPVIESFDTVEEYFSQIGLCASDLIVTNKFLLNGDVVDIHGAQIVYQEFYGAGEPSDEMLMAMRGAISRDYSRVVGVGGGTVLDLSKLLCLDFDGIDTVSDFQQLMLGKRPVKKACDVLLVPTTCGTGSEVTNVAVMLLKSLNVKVGLANPALYAKSAAMIPVLLKTLPHKPMVLSAIDALIHACESYLSPKASPLTRTFSVEASVRILEGFVQMANGREADEEILGSFLIASNMAGIAFGNAGCGMVHAMSYPIGGTYHLPHGEANYEVFLPVFRFYEAMADKQPLENLKQLIAAPMGCEPKDALDALEALLAKIYPRRPLREIGVTDEQCVAFAADVWEKQQRLLGNSMRPVTEADVCKVYMNA